VGKRNIDVGSESPTGKASQPIVKSPVATDVPPKFRGASPSKTKKICGAMSQQRGDGGRGNESAPQEFVQLVGYRDPKARPDPWVRPRPAPGK
jgi:hypothetical protein